MSLVGAVFLRKQEVSWQPLIVICRHVFGKCKVMKFLGVRAFFVENCQFIQGYHECIFQTLFVDFVMIVYGAVLQTGQNWLNDYR